MKKIKKRFDKKAQLNISFGWLFAIIVGAVILVLTIYGVTKLIKSSGSEQAVVGAKELGVLLNPLETGSESAISTPLNVPVETRIYNGCDPFGNFGEQGIRLSEFSFNKWSPPGTEVSFENKYIFSNKIVEGKNFYIFSKPFEFPFKVADLVYLTSSKENYCFVNAPLEIEEEIKIAEDNYFQDNIKLKPDCPENSIKVCFGSSNCEINVKYNYVEKNGDQLYFNGDALMYAAIFSDKDIYDCQVERLLKRTKKLASLYSGKALLMGQRSCNTNLEDDLDWLSKIDEKSDISKISVEDIKQNPSCKLW